MSENSQEDSDIVLHHTPRRKMRRLSDATIAKAIKGSLGNVAYIARKLQTSRMTIYRRLNASAKLKELYDEENETTLDNIENELMTLMNPATNDDPRVRLEAIKFYMDRKGRSRGYGTHLDVETKAAQEPPKPVIRFEES